ncbi:MAG: long-chain-acyl-CoA synthetase [Pseudomonadota bacterium]|nr:long-chain-acyl-CoA synthetase [Pseudomonadota bacterium]
MGVFQTIQREANTILTLSRFKKWTGDITPDSENLVADDFERVVDKYPNNVAWRFEGQLITYAEMDALANKAANWALSLGLQPGDAVALFMENRPEYVSFWYGLSKVGIVVGLINHNLTDKALAHCVNIADAKIILTGADQDEAIRSANGLFEGDPKVWSYGGQEGEDLIGALAAASDARPSRDHRAQLRGKDLCLYVYTSGTTGLPKAARLTQARTQGMMRSFIAPCKITSRDRVYITLPLYHGTGGLCGVGQALMTGASIILRKKFSASQFWDDAADHGATAIVYIGELCRYLVNSPAHPKERAHKIRTGFGNGLRPDIWEEFLTRFNIPHICEFYGSTEGNVSFIGFDGKVGAVGRIPSYLEKSSFGHVAFVKFDVVEEEPVRGADGFCIKTDPGEPGEAIGKVGDDVRTRFEGYNDEAATKKKILHDVFEKGDMWFRTGDLMSKDAEGYIYFIDRIGDTFRWKGENVSTNEVAEFVARAPGIATANIFGVSVPGTDGRAGMAAITTDGEVDFDGLYAWLSEQLPKYAIPLFIRVQQEAETTGTFKYRKVELVEEGFDPEKVSEPLWYFDPESNKYEPLTPDAHETILSGAVKF